MTIAALVRPLFAGAVDVVGDVHGEIEALQHLLQHLGYGQDGSHPDGRRLVFLGDLTDRGPDSPAVVRLVQRLVDTGRARCVLGNHDLNLLLGDKKPENPWFFGSEFRDDQTGDVIPQVLADEPTRQEILAFFRRLPLCLERQDLRVVHACWDPLMVELARQATDAVELFRSWEARIKADLAECPATDDTAAGLERQNRNPVKVLTSGPERRAPMPFVAGGKTRYAERVRWWESVSEDQPFCVFGHYGLPVDGEHGNHRALCADYRVGKRWEERRQPGFAGTFRSTKLGAVRLPERTVVFDDGKNRPCPA